MASRKSVRNYTTGLEANRSASEVLGLLARYGAAETTIVYEGTAPRAIAFLMDKGYGAHRYRLPVRVERVHARMQRDVRAGRLKPSEATVEQAARTAWRNVFELLDVLLSTTETGQTEPDEILFGFLEAADCAATIYESYVERHRALDPRKES